MKTLLMYFQVVLLICGVFDADAEEVKTVMEGDSVTLNTNLTHIQGFILLLWRFGEKGSTIAQIDGNKPSYEDVKGFKGRLKLDQTGSLTITNVRTNHSGPYEAEINHNSGTSNQKFSLTVYVSPSVIAEGETELKSVSVTAGDPVTLDVPQIQGDELIVWRFGDEGKLIAKADIETKSSSLYDERFRDRLKLDQNGSLIITNTRTTDSGLYTTKISSNKQTLYKRFTVTVNERGFSGGHVAGIVIGVLLLAAAAAGVIYYFLRPRITNLPNKTLRETEGDPVTLNPEPEIQRGDQIQWLFGDEDTLIAEIEGENREIKTYDGPDEIFKNKLKLETTGSLTIKDILTKHTGLFTLKIRRGRETFYKRFFVSVEERKITVTEGKPVTLEPVYEINTDDLIHWLFGDEEQQTGIVEFNVKTGNVFPYDYVADGRFRDRLELDKTTGSLTIKNTTTEHSGRYKLQITSSRGFSEQIFTVTVRVEQIFLEEDSVTLNPDTEIKRDDLILWMFGDQDKILAQIRGGTVNIYDDDVNERFRDRLKLDETGSLTITKIEAKHMGLYKLQIIRSSGGILCKRFKVLIKLRYESVTVGEPVRLYTPYPENQTFEEIRWLFGDENFLIAEIKGGTGKTYDGPDKRFRDRLELNEKTGDLIIMNSTDEHTGHYKLKISSSKGNTNRTYSVIVRGALATKEAREKSLMKEKTGKRVNDSATVVMPLLNGEDPDGGNEEEGTSSL